MFTDCSCVHACVVCGCHAHFADFPLDLLEKKNVCVCMHVYAQHGKVRFDVGQPKRPFLVSVLKLRTGFAGGLAKVSVPSA